MPKTAYVVKISGTADPRHGSGEIYAQVFRRGASRKAEFEPPDEIGPEVLGELWARTSAGEPFMRVTHVRVSPRRRGLGTRLYEIASLWSCRYTGKPLASDIIRSAASDRFWKKQVDKGRAVCTASVKAANERDYDVEDRIEGRSGCLRYRLKQCPAPKSLAGVKRARARR